MKALGTILILAAAWIAAALECSLVPTFAVNVEDQWRNILPGRPPQLNRASRLVPGQPMRVYLPFSGFALKDGQADLVFSLEMKQPDGSVKMIKPDLIAFKGMCPGNKGVFLNTEVLCITFEEDDPKGDYELIARLSDRISGESAEAKSPVRLEAYADEIRELTLPELAAVVSNYYRAPRPELVFSCIYRFFELQNELKKGKGYSPMPWLGAFAQLLALNPQYLATALQYAAELPEEERLWLCVVLHELKPELLKPYVGSMDASVAGALKKMENRTSFFAIPAKIETPDQLDLLWMQFFATGREAYIHKLAECAGTKQEKLSVEEFKKLGSAATPEDRRKLMNQVIEQAAVWSIESNAKRHPLVLFYLEGLMQRKKLAPEAAFAVDRVLQKLNKIAPKAK